jgi:hypothetical protein
MPVDCFGAVAKLLVIAESILDSWNTFAPIIALVVTVLASDIRAATFQSSEAIWTGTMISIVGDCLGVNVQGLAVNPGMIAEVSFAGNARRVEQANQIAVPFRLSCNESRQEHRKDSDGLHRDSHDANDLFVLGVHLSSRGSALSAKI